MRYAIYYAAIVAMPLRFRCYYAIIAAMSYAVMLPPLFQMLIFRLPSLIDVFFFIFPLRFSFRLFFRYFRFFSSRQITTPFSIRFLHFLSLFFLHA